MTAAGLNGDWAGSCIVCFTPTDTALAFQGEPEWCIAGLVALGVPEDQAAATFAAEFGTVSPLGVHTVPSEEVTAMYRVCSACASAKGMVAPALVIVGEDTPCYRQPVVAS
ncbi:hypothetical protein LH935_03540 [Gordonia polyisoprenivorans]|uniref:hypothetical protein n=1 Tax=Gordonia polyisoprenivorans TaxID=84595 RepID=UPI00223425B3|nr:hypothetical protein LH935_03540 [Gordonia polyisoprenivorans]